MKIRRIHILSFPALFILLYSCSFSKLAIQTPHAELSASNFKNLSGRFSYPASAGNMPRSTIFQHYLNDTVPAKKAYTFHLTTISSRKLQVDFLVKDSLLRSLKFNGRLKNGFFRSKKRTTATFPVGILIWGLRNERLYFGVTAQNDLLVINSNGAVAFFTVMPVSGGGGDYHAILERQ